MKTRKTRRIRRLEMRISAYENMGLIRNIKELEAILWELQDMYMEIKLSNPLSKRILNRWYRVVGEIVRSEVKEEARVRRYESATGKSVLNEILVDAFAIGFFENVNLSLVEVHSRILEYFRVADLKNNEIWKK